MNIIIAGAGRVGYNLARALSINHNVTVIDRNSEALMRLQESIDMLPIHGDIEDPETYNKLIDKESDLFIAVTDLDEANLLSTLIADDAIDIKRRFIRLRNPQFEKTNIAVRLGIDESFYPLKLTSETVTTLLRYPRANNVKRFEYTDFKLISVHISKDMVMNLELSDRVAIVGVERNKKFILYDREMDIFKKDDLIYLFGNETYIRQLCPKFDDESPLTIERCIVFGAGELGINIARGLINEGVEVKLIEKSVELCHIADEALEGEAMTLNCKYGTATLFDEEGLSYADMAIAATEDDEYNIVKCLEAREHGIQKVMAVNNDIEYYNVMHSLGIVVIRGPKINAFNAIVEKINSTKVVSERKFCGGKAEVYMRKIFPNSHLIGSKLKLPRYLKESLVYLIRQERLIDAMSETIVLEENDIISVFTLKESVEEIQKWINGL